MRARASAHVVATASRGVVARGGEWRRAHDLNDARARAASSTIASRASRSVEAKEKSGASRRARDRDDRAACGRRARAVEREKGSNDRTRRGRSRGRDVWTRARARGAVRSEARALGLTKNPPLSRAAFTSRLPRATACIHVHRQRYPSLVHSSQRHARAPTLGHEHDSSRVHRHARVHRVQRGRHAREVPARRGYVQG